MMDWNEAQDIAREMGICPICNDVGCGCEDEFNIDVRMEAEEITHDEYLTSLEEAEAETDTWCDFQICHCVDNFDCDNCSQM